jgi:CelD/BcsL family acetyltransferase involved in cellulose biosynthesis
VLTRNESPVIAPEEADFEEWLRSRSKNFREKIRRGERKLGKAHELAYRHTDAESLDADLDTLIRLHRARWGEESDSFEGRREAFHRDHARRALERGWLRLWTLELDGRPAASWLGFRFGRAEWYYQAGRDPEFEREAVGFVLMVHTIRTAFDDGMREYRLLLGGEAYKSRFANRDDGLHTVLLGSGAIGGAVEAAAGLAAATPQLRARLKRFAR